MLQTKVLIYVDMFNNNKANGESNDFVETHNNSGIGLKKITCERVYFFIIDFQLQIGKESLILSLKDRKINGNCKVHAKKHLLY